VYGTGLPASSTGLPPTMRTPSVCLTRDCSASRTRTFVTVVLAEWFFTTSW